MFSLVHILVQNHPRRPKVQGSLLSRDHITQQRRCGDIVIVVGVEIASCGVTEFVDEPDVMNVDQVAERVGIGMI